MRRSRGLSGTGGLSGAHSGYWPGISGAHHAGIFTAEYDERAGAAQAKAAEWITGGEFSEVDATTGEPAVAQSYGDFDPYNPNYLVEDGQFFYSADNVRLPNLEFEPSDFELLFKFAEAVPFDQSRVEVDEREKVERSQERSRTGSTAKDELFVTKDMWDGQTIDMMQSVGEPDAKLLSALEKLQEDTVRLSVGSTAS